MSIEDTQADVEAIELEMDEAKVIVARGVALDRLRTNADFQDLILNGYLKDEAVRLVHLKAKPEMAYPERQAAIATSIDAIGEFVQYLNAVVMAANTAAKAIDDCRETLAEIDAEGSDE